MDIEKAIKVLAEAKEQHIQLGKMMSEAYQGTIYHMDLFVAAVLNRSLYLIDGFSMLVLDRNYISSAPLLRLQLDNALRLHAAWLVDEPHQFVIDVMSGKQIRNLKDSSGERPRNMNGSKRYTRLVQAISIYQIHIFSTLFMKQMKNVHILFRWERERFRFKTRCFSI